MKSKYLLIFDSFISYFLIVEFLFANDEVSFEFYINIDYYFIFFYILTNLSFIEFLKSLLLF